jgi:hypothetical protein
MPLNLAQDHASKVQSAPRLTDRGLKRTKGGVESRDGVLGS